MSLLESATGGREASQRRGSLKDDAYFFFYLQVITL
jgi:hypothetical protein